MLSRVFKTVATIPLPEVTVVYPAVAGVLLGALHPEGTVILKPPLSMVSAAVRVKLKLFPAELTVTFVGETTFVPEPSAATAWDNGTKRIPRRKINETIFLVKKFFPVIKINYGK